MDIFKIFNKIHENIMAKNDFEKIGRKTAIQLLVVIINNKSSDSISEEDLEVLKSVYEYTKNTEKRDMNPDFYHGYNYLKKIFREKERIYKTDLV